MKRIAFLLILFLLFGECRAQFTASPDSIYTFMKFNSATRDRVHWEREDERFRVCMQAARSAEDTVNCLVGVLAALNDVHSSIQFNGKRYAHYAPMEESERQRLYQWMSKAQSLSGKVKAAMLPGKIAYLRVPGYSLYDPAQIHTAAQGLRDSLLSLAVQKPRGYLIDLRFNTGGNLYPMLAGLSPLLGTGVVAQDVDADGAVVRHWRLAEGNLWLEDKACTWLPVYQGIDLSKAKVVVMLGPVTMSSGSITAVAFKQRPRTTFLGEPTAAGYTTSTNFFYFSPEVMLNFATHFVADRDRVIHDAVQPDVLVRGEAPVDELEKDAQVKAAMEQIKKPLW